MLCVGILAGMGPFAGARFLGEVLEAARDQFGARQNHEFPHLLLSSLPVADLVLERSPAEPSVRLVEAEVDALVRAGAEAFALACHTMHLFLPRFRARAGERPFLSLVDATEHVLARTRPKRIGVLATPTSIAGGLYQDLAVRLGADLLVPDTAGLEVVADVAARGISGSVDGRDGERIAALASELTSRGAEAVILGCTELSLLDLPASHLGATRIVDPLAALAERVCHHVYGGKV